MTKNECVMLVRVVKPECYGGGESYQLLLASELKKHGFRPVIVTSSVKLLEKAKKEGFEVVEAPYIRNQNYSGLKNLFLPVYLGKIKRLEGWYVRLFEKFQPKTINVQSRDEWLAATRAGKRLGINVIWTEHIDFRTWVMTNVEIPYKNMIGKMILRQMKGARKVIFVSDYEKKWFMEHCGGNRQNLITIKNGVIDKYDEYSAMKTRKKSFCYVGRLVDYKGIRELISAFRKVEDAEARLNIYGEGKDYTDLAGNDTRIRFMGYTNAPLVAMAENEVFVLPSYYEGLSIALVEAAMMEKTIIATNVDGNPEVVKNGKSGILVSAQNETALRKAMEKIINEPREAQEFAKNARENYLDNFNFEKIFESQMMELYVL